MGDRVHEEWGAGGPYEQYMGRWSREVAREFLSWLGAAPSQTWADVGCGTGALAGSILAAAAPRAVAAIDRSPGFVAAARGAIADPRAHFAVADASALPWASSRYGVAVAALLLNFVPDALAVVREMARVTQPGGTVAAYVWDYRGGMEMLRHFWDVAGSVDPAATALDQGERFPLCQPEPLAALFAAAGLRSVAVRPIVIPTIFRDFDDYWLPFLGKQGSAPTYVASLDPETRERLRLALRAHLAAADGPIAMTAQAWAVQGTV
jgi:SAM-dependent methyltransferase